MLNKDQVYDFLTLFRFLNFEDIYKLSRLARYRKLKAGDLFIELGSEKRKVAYIQQGIMRAYFIREDGEERTHFFAKEKEPIGSIEVLLENQASTQVIEALEDCKIWEVDYDLLQDFLDRHPKFEKARKHMLQDMIVRSSKRIKSFVVNTPEERYLHLLEQGDIVGRVQDKHLASFLGITPVSLSRIRKRLAEKSSAT
ncbi:MAG: Crp/Fnr family transcriptional regulator [Bacteroidetes bacterium]|nr:MAG: Crp/Fnr family transcriptional regulator [Bacteroidota bacterium]